MSGQTSRSGDASALQGVSSSDRPEDPEAFAATDARLLARRIDFPPLETFIWLQNGGVSLVPRPVHEVHVGLSAESFERGPLHIAFPEEEYPRRTRSRERIARYLGADEGEVAIVRGVSEAFAHVIRGIDWTPGDELILSADEEGALLVPALQLRRERGVIVHTLAVLPDGDPEMILEQARELLGQRTRLLAFSHVTTDIGARLPAAALCRLAEARGVPTFLDVAHSAGAIDVDLHAIGATYAGAVSYKWMMAPYAAGLLYVRADRLATTPIVFAGGRSDRTLDRVGGTMTLHPDTQRFEYGPWAWPLVHAWAASLDYQEALGREAIHDRTARLAVRIKTVLGRDSRVQIHTPRQPERSANLIAFGVVDWPGKDLARYLREQHSIVVRPLMDEPDGIRASVAFFTSEREVDALIDAIDRLPASPS